MNGTPDLARDISQLIGVLGICFAVFLAILWTILPFAVFGIKSRLDSVNSRLQEVASRLGRIADLLVESQQQQTPPVIPRQSTDSEKPEREPPPWSGFSGPT